MAACWRPLTWKPTAAAHAVGLYASQLLSLNLPQDDKRLLAFVETDGCFADGVAVATGCTVGHRTLAVVDYGKVAAVFVDTETSCAFRVSPHPAAREHATTYAPSAGNHWQAQLEAYCVMPAQELLRMEPVALTTPVAAIISQPGLRVPCDRCGEEIMNEREVVVAGRPFCRGCGGQRYYEWLAPPEPARPPTPQPPAAERGGD